MENAAVTHRHETLISVLEKVLIQGDLAELTPQERLVYYRQLCESLNINPLTRPFDYLRLNGKLVLYAKRDCAEQLRRRDHITVRVVSREILDGDIYRVTAVARTPNGREDEDSGAVCLTGLRGESLANAMMKAETKGKRRVTLSICGLGFLDETEVDSVPNARRVVVDEQGEIVERPRSVQAGAPKKPILSEAKALVEEAKEQREAREKVEKPVDPRDIAWFQTRAHFHGNELQAKAALLAILKRLGYGNTTKNLTPEQAQKFLDAVNEAISSF